MKKHDKKNLGKKTGRAGHLRLGTGWLPDEADPRDYTYEHASVSPALDSARVVHALKGERGLPASVDLREWCPPVQFQGGFNTCSAHVVAGLLEFFEKRAFGKSVEASRLFLYKVTKNFLEAEGNAGVYIRQTMGTLKLIGVPPEKYWPYPDPGTIAAPRTSDPRLDQEPPSFCYALAGNYRAISYYRLDGSAASPPPGQATTTQVGGGSGTLSVLTKVKAHLAASIAVAFGFPLHASAIKQSKATGKLPLPAAGDPQVGNHAAIAVGYDDRLRIENTDKGGPTSTGALLIQNSWSDRWGEGGYGWVPYEYVERGRARDFWTLTKAEWVDTGRFQLPLEE